MQSLDDQAKSDFQEKDRNSKAKKKTSFRWPNKVWPTAKDSKQKANKNRKALYDQAKSDLRQKDSKQKAKKEKLPKLKKLSRMCMNQTDNANQMKGETRP
jgi:hypothetical protein